MIALIYMTTFGFLCLLAAAVNAPIKKSMEARRQRRVMEQVPEVEPLTEEVDVDRSPQAVDGNVLANVG